ncbi:MAG: NAD(P)H-hydrate dehydratase [Actinomycetaceae bacterium]|nr:NAD(P)H-hydrate dehydratase [Actinomycetaceae bacterium]MDU0970638.1 NAD(P)H-hydrate dehydratase [Actinomycetaceae bacterium]
MIRAFATADIREAEYALVQKAPTDQLMKKAAGAVAETCAQLVSVRRGASVAASPTSRGAATGRVVALVGGGDNGGDALYALAFLARGGTRTDAVILSEHPHERGLRAAEAAGVTIHRPDLAEAPRRLAVSVARVVSGCDVVVDGLVGTGASGALREPLSSVVDVLAQALRDAGSRLGRGHRLGGDEHRHAGSTGQPAKRPHVVAVDIPSGLGGEDGQVAGPHLVADVTVTMGAVKPSALLAPACYSVGQVRVCDLGLPLPPSVAKVTSLEAGDVGCILEAPNQRDHKYTRGVVAVLAGSREYPLTGVMCVEAAARAGAGMVRYFGPDEAALAVLTRIPEVVTARGRFQSALVGPGLASQDEQRVAEAREIVRQAKAAHLPVVIDAGALDAWNRLLATVPEQLPGPQAVLTPHAGEAARLLSRLGEGRTRGGVSRAEVEERPAYWAGVLAKETGCVIVCKGAATTICAPSGDLVVQRHAPAWTGTAGSGDVLAGTIASVLAGGQARAEQAGRQLSQSDLVQAAAAGVWLHGQAARIACGLDPYAQPIGYIAGHEIPTPEPPGAGAPIVATDIAEALPRAVSLALAAGPLRYAG